MKNYHKPKSKQNDANSFYFFPGEVPSYYSHYFK